MSAPLPGEIVFDERLITQPYHVGLDLDQLASFAVAACQDVQVHPDTMDALRLVYSVEHPDGKLGLYTAWNQTATVYVPACVEDARAQGLAPEKVLSDTTIHEVGHHLTTDIRHEIGQAAWVGLAAACIVRPLCTSPAEMSVGTIAAYFGGAVAGLAGAMATKVAYEDRAQAHHRCEPQEVGARTVEKLFGSQFSVVQFIPFKRIASGETARDIVLRAA